MHKLFPKDVFNQTVLSLVDIYEQKESRSLANLILDKIYRLNPSDIIINQSFEPTPDQKQKYDDAINRLQNHEPIQYVLNEAYFFGRIFYVDENVLIPRQETESLIQLIKDYQTWNSPRILDIGTGSGCIAITLALDLQDALVTANDICESALTIAKKNADLLSAEVQFSHLNILENPLPDIQIDLVVSNPPYVLDSEKETIRRNVLEYEPSKALFVPDNDPLLYYRTIIEKVSKILNPGGQVFFEINEQFGGNLLALFQRFGYIEPKIYKDLNDKQRFASAILP